MSADAGRTQDIASVLLGTVGEPTKGSLEDEISRLEVWLHDQSRQREKQPKQTGPNPDPVTAEENRARRERLGTIGSAVHALNDLREYGNLIRDASATQAVGVVLERAASLLHCSIAIAGRSALAY